MTTNYDQYRTVILDYLRDNKCSKLEVPSMGNDDPICKLCQERGLSVTDENKEIILQIFHELYLERIIVPGDLRQVVPNNTMCWPPYRVTAYGEKVLSTPEYVPHDPSGYLARLKNEISAIDDVVILYLEEALGCFQANYLFASAVMLGCAAEKAMLQLIEAFGISITDSQKKIKYEKETKSWIIKKKYDALWKWLEPLANNLPNDLADDLHTILDRVFDLIRTTRNDAGHPTGKKIERDTIRANFILFPKYCKRVYALMEYFKNNPIT